MEKITVGFTGTQHGMKIVQLRALQQFMMQHFWEWKDVAHGDCDGADEEFHLLCRELFPDLPIHIFPPEIDTHRAYCKGAKVVHPPKPFLERNHDIVDSSDFMLAAPLTMREVLRSGTWATVRYARKKGRGIAIFLPDGSVQVDPGST